MRGTGRRLAPAVVVIAALAGGCQQGGQDDFGPKTGIGAALGAAGGGLLAAAAGGAGTGIAAGVLLGGLAGGALGSTLDAQDRNIASRTTQNSLETVPSGTTSNWSNPDSGNSGSFTPTRTYQDSSGQYCREYQQTITVGGQKEQSYGTACRQPDGSWKIVS
ncbi:MAG: RT0821/Lpp0805 family surface protein [Pseudomonadota bacterium]